MGLPGWANVLIVGGATVGVIIFLFKGARARLIALFSLAPLLALAAVLVAVGSQPRADDSHVQEDPTIFGDGSHEAGASHAAQTAAGASEGTRHEAQPEGPSLRDLGARLTRLDGLTWPDTGTTYTVSSLWNRIDGGAELYKKYGMKRAVFATARHGEADIEVQLFNMGSAEKARTLFDDTDRDEGATPLGAGDRGVLWAGGGEIVVGAVYGRIIISAAVDDPELAAMPKKMLEALAGPAGTPKAAAPEKGSDEPAPVEPEPAAPKPAEPAPSPAAPPSLAERLGIGEHLVGFYGIESVSGGDGPGDDRIVTLKDAWAAAAWAQTLCDDEDTADDAFGCSGPKQTIRVRGNRVVWARGEGAVSRATTASESLPSDPLPGLAALVGATERRVQVGGWNGRKELGGVVIGTWDDGVEAFVAAPEDAESIFKALVAGWEEPEVAGDITVVSDEYQGEVLLQRVGTLIVGLAGAETREKGLKRLTAIVAASRAPSQDAPPSAP